MKLDKLVEQRLNELDAKAAVVAQTQHGDYREYVSHESFYEWANSVLNLLHRVFGENSTHYQNFYAQYQKFNYSFTQFEICRGIFRAAKEDYLGGYLFNVRSLVKAEVLEDSLDQASELLRAGYKDPACVLVGIALETTVKELCTRASIPHGKVDRMNADLSKAGVYNMAKQKQITAWAELRNKAAHGDWTAYTQTDVNNFLIGVRQFMADFL